MPFKPVGIDENNHFPVRVETRLATDFGSGGGSLVNVKSAPFGAIGNNVADDTAAIQSAITASAGRRVYFPAGTYKVTGTLTVPTGSWLDTSSAVLDFTTMPDGTALNQRIGFTSTGTRGANVVISTAITQWSRVISGVASTATLVAGDLVLIRNTEIPVPGLTRTNNDRVKGELAIVDTVDSATQITLKSSVIFGYATTGLMLNKVTPVDNVIFSGLTMTMGGVTSAHTGIKVTNGRDIRVVDCKIIGGEDNGVSLATVYNGIVSECDIRDCTSSATLGSTGYGTAVLEGSRFITLSDNYYENCRHWVAGGGQWPAVQTNVINCSGVKASAAGYDCHESTFYWRFINNRAVNSSVGYSVRGQYISLDDNEAYGTTGAAVQVLAYDGVTEQQSIKVRGTTIDGCASGVFAEGQLSAATTDNCRKYNLEITGSRISNVSLSGGASIFLRNFTAAVVSNNSINGSQTDAIDARGLASGEVSTGLIINNNVVRDSVASAVNISSVDDVSGNIGQVLDATDSGIMFSTCDRINLTGVTVRTSRLNGMLLAACTDVSITGASITNVTGANNDCIRVQGSTDVNVTGGMFQSTRYAVNTTTSNWISVTGANVHQCANATKILTDASAVNELIANNL